MLSLWTRAAVETRPIIDVGPPGVRVTYCSVAQTPPCMRPNRMDETVSKSLLASARCREGAPLGAAAGFVVRMEGIGQLPPAKAGSLSLALLARYQHPRR